MFMFFINYLLLLLAASIFTNGFFLITRGNWETMPDETRVKKGALLKGWWFYWFKEYPTAKKYYYAGDELRDMFDMIRAVVPHSIIMDLKGEFISERLQPKFFKDFEIGNTFTSTIEFLPCLPALRKKLGVDFRIKSIAEGIVTIQVFKEEPHYVHSYYLRTMLAGCITCFSSFYGALIFIVAHLLFSNEIINYSFYDFFGNVSSFVSYPVMLICFCVSLSYINTFLWKKLN